MKAYIFPLWFGLILSGSAAAIDPPKMRPSPYFGNILGMKYTSIDDLGEHRYGGSFGENNALLYTAKGGYIDLGHLRESADRTRYLFEICYENITNHKTDFSYSVIEPAEYHVHLEYPSQWNTYSIADQQKIAREISIDMGQHFAQRSTIWHEIVTWYGYASTGLLSEKPSSFSWEDGYSDLLGSKLAAEVLRQDLDYDRGMTDIMVQKLSTLDPQSASIAEQATEKIKGKWYSGRYPFITMHKRNFDVGFDDGQITPFRVPGICTYAPAEPGRVPALDSLALYGFTMHLTMTPHESERRNILKIIYPNRSGTTLDPERDFPILIQHIRKEAIREVGKDVDKPTL